ncbi:MAG TPA: glycosyltransferase family 4 protein [Gemmatimonadaceae bacterium]|nr:glycosyltransferase family 4 protein [Gemmatimonadaceae bacterium]
MQRVAADLHESLRAHSGIAARALVLRAPWSQRGYLTPMFLARAVRDIRRLARGREIDAVLFSSMVAAAVAVPLKSVLKRNGIVSATIVNGLDATTPTWPYPLLVKKIFGAVDAVFPISRATAEACHARGLERSKSQVIPLGIRLDRFTAIENKPSARRALEREIQSLHHGAAPGFIISSVGRLVPRKGVAWFVKNVMPMLPADVHFVVAGEGEERGRIELAIAHHSLANRVTLLGRVTDEKLERVYRGSDLFLMPNVPVTGDMEGFGLVMLEAGLCGLPVIASDIEGITDVITEDKNGHLVKSGDAQGFVTAIMRYYRDRDLLTAASDMARTHTVSCFGWAGVTERYLEELRLRVGGVG